MNLLVLGGRVIGEAMAQGLVKAIEEKYGR